MLTFLFQVLTEYAVQDLNVNPKLPFEDNSFDVITNVVCDMSSSISSTHIVHFRPT